MRAVRTVGVVGLGAMGMPMARNLPARRGRSDRRARGGGRRFLDAPASGGTAGASGGTLSTTDTLDTARPVLEALGSKVPQIGGTPGQGAAVKTANQPLCGVYIATAAEAMSFAGAGALQQPYRPLA